VDLWSGKDQSGNNPEATLANAAAAGVGDRMEVHTADMTALPFADGSFDVVTSALAIHNLPSPEGRSRAVDEAMRVLRPGGQLLVADFWWMARKYAGHLGQGTLRSLGPGYWYGAPFSRRDAAACRKRALTGRRAGCHPAGRVPAPATALPQPVTCPRTGH
jgi:SAM-dependent methyltransferase